MGVSSALHRALADSGLNTNMVNELCNGLALARGVSSITGTGDVVTGLKSVVAVIATLQDDAALTGNLVTATVGDQATAPVAGSVTLKVWKPTATGDSSPIAATAAKNVNWIALGVAF